MRRDQLPEHVRPNYVMPEYKAVYIAVSKAACTSLKWLVADVQGEQAEQFRAVSRMVTRDMGIHQRGRWRRTPTLHSLEDRALAEISPENGWFTFTVVRHPALRAFSAWQSKLLLREPRWVIKHGQDAWFPGVPSTTDDVVDGFRRFVAAMAADPGQRLMQDRHFMPQWREAAPDRVPYSRVYRTGEIGELMTDFESHLRAHGYEGELRLRDSNETPLRPLTAVFGPDVVAGLRTLYGDDYRGLGFAEDVPATVSRVEAYPDAALADVRRLIERHERIGDLAELALGLERELAAARAAEKHAPRLAVRLKSKFRAAASRG